MWNEPLNVNDINYKVKISFEDINQSKVSIFNDSIIIKVPFFLNREERFKEIFTLKSWIKQKILDNPAKFKPILSKKYTDGDLLKVGSNEYKLCIEFKDKQDSSAKIIDNNIFLVISANLSEDLKNKHISTLLSRCVARQRLSDLYLRINDLNKKHFNQQLRRIFFKNNKSNWGSCSKQGNINISTRLLFAPDDVLDYVCIHELAHLIEHNHSDRFWALVKKAMPDYKQKELWLKENSDKCLF